MGNFSREEEAARDYDAEAKRVHGDNASSISWLMGEELGGQGEETG